MMLKKLFDEYDLVIERILSKEYKRLKLTSQELNVLLALFSVYRKRKTFSIGALQRRLDYTINDIGKAVESLLEKKFMSVHLEQKEGKEREVFSLDETLNKVEQLWIQDIEDIKIQSFETEISKTIQVLEQTIGRPILPYELERIRQWFLQDHRTYQEIISAIQVLKNRTSIKQIDVFLNQNHLEKVEIDQQVDQTLDEIFQSMK